MTTQTLSKGNIFRIVSLTLAGGDVFQTIPETIAFYKKQLKRGRLSAACFFYAMARYMTVLSLIGNGYESWSTSYTLESCKRYYLWPNVTALLAGMAVQILVYIRTVAISGRSKYVRFGLGAFLILGFPVQTFGIVYHRDPRFTNGICKGVVFNGPDWNIVYYSAHMAWDLIACTTATYFLISSSRIEGKIHTSKLLRRILRDGLLYFVAVFLVNLWVVLEFAHVFVSGAASTLPLAIVLIAVQHLILSTQRMTLSNTTTEFYGSVSQGPPHFYTRSNSQHLDVELESGVFAGTRDQKVSFQSSEPTATVKSAPAEPEAGSSTTSPC